MASELLAPPLGSLSDLSKRFDGLASRIRQVALVRGLGRLTLITAALCAVGLLADWLWTLPGMARFVWLGAIALTMAYTIWREVVRPYVRKFTIAELAAIVETEYPELGERLTSAVELTDPAIPEDHKGSALMREWLEAETISSTRHLDFRQAVSSDRAKQSAFAGGLAALVLVIPFLLLPSGYGPLWARLLLPWGSHELPGVLYFHVPDGTRVVARGEDVIVLALPPEGVSLEDLPEAVELAWTNAQGETHQKPMEYVADQHGFVATLPHVFEDFEYIVTAKRKRSDRHKITVLDRPEITAFTLVITPPAYTGQQEQKVDGAIGDVTVFERSRVKAVVEFNKPLADVKWLWRESQQPNPQVQTQDAAKPTALPFLLSEDKKSATLELLASEGWFRVKASDEHGLANLEETPRKLIILPDQPPELSLSGESGTTRARRDDVISLDASVKDDVAVAALELHLETSAGQIQVRPMLPEELGKSEVNGSFELDLAALDLADGASLTYRVRAADNRPVPGPNEVWSEERRILIDPNAEPSASKDVTNRQNELRDVLEAIRKDLKKNLEDTARLAEEAKAKNASGEPFTRQNELAALENQERDLSDRLEQLANQFAENRLFANLTPETQRIAREPLKAAVLELQKAQEQDQIQEQAETLEKAEAALAKADEDLKKLTERFEELTELEQALLVLPRLAQQAERVADQALELAKRRDNPPAGETPEQKAAREEQLQREEALVEEERQRLAEALDDLLNQRPEVLEAARKTALEQIAELSKEAARLADRQDALTESLKSEAQAAANKAVPIAEKQDELLKKAEELSSPKPKDNAQVTPIDPGALRKVLEDLKAGNLDAASKQQDAVADRLESLAAELKKNQELPKDPKAAAAELAKRQRELQSQLAEAAKNPPDENAPAEEKQSFENTLRELAEKQTGIQAGIAQIEAPAPNRKEQQDALDQAAKAVDNLLKGKADESAENADHAAKTVEQLAENIKTPEERAAQAKEDVEALRKQQADLKKAAQEAAKENSNLDELAQRQNDIAERLAQVDAPQAEEARREALHQSLQAKSDLEKERLEDIETSQNLAEQALADLAKNLDGQPTSRDEVEDLQKRQQAIAQEAAKAENQTQLTEQAKAQNQVAERLENLDAPAAEPERKAAEDAARNAARSLENPMDPGQTQAVVQEAKQALDQLENALAPRSPGNAAEAAEELAKRQSEAAEAAQNTAENAQKNHAPPTPAERKEQAEELAQRTEEAKRLPAGEMAAEQKHEALEALQKAAKAEEELEELIKKQEQAVADNPSAPPKPEDKEELERLVQENAEAQKQAADALEELQQELAKKENQETLHNEWNEAKEQAEQLAKENQPKPNPNPPVLLPQEDVEQLAEEARAIQEEIEQLKQEIAGLDQKQPAQPEEAAQPEQNPAQNAQAANDQASNDQEPKNQPANASRPNDSETNPSRPNDQERNDSDPKDSNSNDSRPKPSPAPMPGESTEKTSSAPANANNSKPEQTPSENAQAQENAEGQEKNPSDQNGSRLNAPRAEELGNSKAEAGKSLAERQAELARKLAELAIKVAQDQGAESSATKEAANAARKADAARQQSQDGALDRAAKTAQEAAEAAIAAAEELAKTTPDAGQGNELAQEVAEQAKAQSKLAKQMAEAAANPAQRRAAQKAGQESLAKSSEKLAEGLREAARKLSSKPLDLEQPGEKTEAAGESASQATQEMQEAKSSAATGNVAKAASAGEKASESLRRAAGEAPAPPEATSENTLVPGDLAEQVADARRRLEEAKKQIETARDERMPPQTAQADENDPPMPMGDDAKAESKATGPMVGQKNPAQSANAQSQPGQQSPMDQSPSTPEQQGQQGQKPSGLAKSAKSLEQAAQALSEAAGKLGGGMPSNQSSTKPGSKSQSQIGQGQHVPGSVSEGAGAQGEFSIEAMEAELRRQNREEWGQLPGHLRTEILQGNKQKSEGDYARLIKLYSEELLKKQQAQENAP